MWQQNCGSGWHDDQGSGQKRVIAAAALGLKGQGIQIANPESAFLEMDTVKRVVFHGAETFFGGYFLGIPAVAVGTMLLIVVSLATGGKAQENVGGDFFE